MLTGKGLGFGKSFAGDDGDLHLISLAPPVKDQIGHRIGGQCFQSGRNLAPLLGRIRARGADLGVQDLIVGDDQLGCQSPRRQSQRGRTQERQRLVKVGAVKCGLTNRHPAPRCAVQNSDGTVAEIECKCWFHSVRLTESGADGSHRNHPRCS